MVLMIQILGSQKPELAMLTVLKNKMVVKP